MIKYDKVTTKVYKISFSKVFIVFNNKYYESNLLLANVKILPSFTVLFTFMAGLLSVMNDSIHLKTFCAYERRRRMRSDTQIVIVGPYPPPIGGNSIHVQRLAKHCLSKGLKCQVVDPYVSVSGKEPSWLIRFFGNQFTRFICMLGWLVLNPYQILHVHVSAMDKFLIVGWFIYFSTMKARMRVITIHSGSFVQKTSKRWPLAKWVSATLLKKFDHIITVNEEQKNFLEIFFKISPKKIHVIPAFIYPSIGKVELPESIKKLRECSPLIVGSGCATSLYAHEVLLDAVSRLQDEGLDIGVVVAVYSKYEEPYFSKLKERIQFMSKVLLVQDMESEMFNRLLELADVYVRTARRDGDSVAVREALFHGCQVVASDCVPRPMGCEIFVTDNVESLYLTLKRILKERAGRNVLIDNSGKDYAEDILSIYGL